VTFSPEMEAQRRQAKRYLYQNLYESPELLRDHDLGTEIIQGLFAHWMEHPEQLPTSYAAQVESEGAPRVIVDYIAGMTDAFCMAQWNGIQGNAMQGNAMQKNGNVRQQ